MRSINANLPLNHPARKGFGTMTNRQTNMPGTIAWRTEWEVGIDAGGMTWVGSVEALEREWA